MKVGTDWLMIFFSDLDFDGIDSDDYADMGSPIGTHENPFIGTFDGNNFTINHLTIDQKIGLFGQNIDLEIQSIGLFSAAEGGTFRNMHFKHVDVTRSVPVAGLIGLFTGDSELYNITVNGEIHGQCMTGGIVNSDITRIHNGSVSAKVTSSDLSSVILNLVQDTNPFTLIIGDWLVILMWLLSKFQIVLCLDRLRE